MLLPIIAISHYLEYWLLNAILHRPSKDKHPHLDTETVVLYK